MALISPPLALSQNRIILGPLTPLPHQNVNYEQKGHENTSMNLEFKYTNTVVQWKSFSCLSSLSLSMYLWDYIKCTQPNKLVSKGSSCSISPPKYVRHLHMDRGGLVQLEHHKYTMNNVNAQSNMIKGIDYIYAIDQSKLRESKTFSSLRNLQNVFSSKGLVKISAS